MLVYHIENFVYTNTFMLRIELFISRVYLHVIYLTKPSAALATSPIDGMIVNHKMGRLWRKPVMISSHIPGGTAKIHEKILGSCCPGWGAFE
jgi:hypothetical protein